MVSENRSQPQTGVHQSGLNVASAGGLHDLSSGRDAAESMGTRFHIHDRFGVQMCTFAQDSRLRSSKFESNGGSRNTISQERLFLRRKSSAEARGWCSRLHRCARALSCNARINGWIVVDERHLRCAARQRFESERTGPGKQIETTCAVDPRRQPIEHGLTRAIGCGAQRRAVWECELSSPPLTADNAHLVHRLPRRSSTCNRIKESDCGPKRREHRARVPSPFARWTR